MKPTKKIKNMLINYKYLNIKIYFILFVLLGHVLAQLLLAVEGQLAIFAKVWTLSQAFDDHGVGQIRAAFAAKADAPLFGDTRGGGGGDHLRGAIDTGGGEHLVAEHHRGWWCLVPIHRRHHHRVRITMIASMFALRARRVLLIEMIQEKQVGDRLERTIMTLPAILSLHPTSMFLPLCGTVERSAAQFASGGIFLGHLRRSVVVVVCGWPKWF